MASTQITTQELWVDGRQMTVAVKVLSPTVIRITWTEPTNKTAFAGAVILLSTETYSSGEFPKDGIRYTAGQGIGKAIVAASYNSYFNEVAPTVVEGTEVVPGIDVTVADTTVIYYASAHASSNILQYYPIGVQSYPLESSRFEKQSDAYAGSLESATQPPDNPIDGQVYFDPTINKVLLWDTGAGAWLEISEKTTPTGKRPPIAALNFFLNTIEKELKVFDMGIWLVCTPVNTEIRTTATTWIPLGTVYCTGVLPDTPANGDVALLISAKGQKLVKVRVQNQWVNLAGSLIRYNMTNLTAGEFIVGGEDPIIPEIGDFFYQTSSRELLSWSGEAWVEAATENAGTPTSDKLGIGTDGSYDERLRLIKILKIQMGYPQICVELSEDSFNVAIDNALDELRRRADNAYQHRHVLFTLNKGQTLYYLNDPRLKTDKIVNVIKIHRMNHIGMNLPNQGSVFSQAFINQYYSGNMVDLVSLHLTHQLAETYEKIFAGNIMFVWDEASRELQLLRSANVDNERVVLEVAMERTEQELLLDRWAKQWLQGWALAEVKEMLGMIRSKYSSVPGPNGGLTLNGDMLLSEARIDFEDLLRQITDFEVGNNGHFGNSSVLIG